MEKDIALSNTNNIKLSSLNNQYKKINSIIILGIVSTIFFIISFFIMLLPFKLVFSWHRLLFFGTPETYINISLGFWAVFLLINTIASIIILSTKWDDKWSKNNMLLWGLLSLLLLTFIGVLIFGYKSKKYFLKSLNINRLGLIRSQFEQLNSIIILSFFSILIFVGFIISCALINPNYISYGYMSYDYNVYNGLIISTSALIAGFGIFNVPVSILILGNDWKNEWANKNKLLWGILSLLLLGFIGSLIFGFISRKKYENEYPKIYDSVNSNNTLNLYKHYKTDLKLSRLLIILCSISLIFFLAFAPTISVVITQEQDGSPGYNMCLVVAIISGTFWQAFNIVLSIIILSFKWENNWARKHQLLFGLLSIFVIFFISIFIFSTKVLKQSKKSLANEEFDNFKKKTRFNQIFETKESDNSNNN